MSTQAAEAIKLRAQGLSLRAIAKQLDTHEKQVRRWLGASGVKTPAKISGLDGRTYRKVSAVGNDNADTADTADSTLDLRWDTHVILGSLDGLRLLMRALNAEHKIMLNGCLGKLPVEEAREIGRKARIAVLAAGLKVWTGKKNETVRLWNESDDHPDSSLECLLAGLARQLLTKEGLATLMEDLS